jgi:hypothetical protein
MWPQFVCPNCRAPADLEADVDDPFPEQDWEEEADFEALEVQQNEALQNGSGKPGNLAPPVQEQAATQSDNIVDTDGSHEKTGKAAMIPSTVGETGLETAFSNHSISKDQVPTISTPPEFTPTSVAPVDIRPGRVPSGDNGSMHVDSFVRNERTPSPNGRTPADVMLALHGIEGPMTPRNDAGPFVFDGSGGLSGAARNLSESPTTRTLEPAA